MKKIILSIIAVIALCSFMVFNLNNTESVASVSYTENSNNEENEEQTNHVDDNYASIGYEASYSVNTDYASLSSDVTNIVSVRVKTKDKSYLDPVDAFIYSNYKVEVINNFKGTAPKNSTVKMVGGELTMDEYVSQNTNSRNEKQGVDNLSKEEKTKKVKMEGDDLSLELKQGEEYLLLLYYDEINDIYNVACNGYGVYSSNGDGSYTNVVSGETITP